MGKTGWAYILDRETGKPLLGIDEKPVPQEPRQKTAATQPFPRGDAIVPQYIEIAPEGHRLVNDGRIFTPFVGAVPTLVVPGIWGGASWPPSSYDPVQRRLFVCASSVINGYTGGGDERFVAPKPGTDYLGGAMWFTRVARTGIIAALDVTTNKLVWRYQWPEQCYSGTLATAGGLLFVGPQRRPAHGPRFVERQPALGVSDRGRHARAGEHVRASRQAVRAGLCRRQRVARDRAGRQRLAAGARRHVAAGGAWRARITHGARGVDGTDGRRPPRLRCGSPTPIWPPAGACSPRTAPSAMATMGRAGTRAGRRSIG